MFNCDKCGLCCRSLHLSDLYHDLDKGDGVCIHLDEKQICVEYIIADLKNAILMLCIEKFTIHICHWKSIMK